MNHYERQREQNFQESSGEGGCVVMPEVPGDELKTLSGLCWEMNRKIQEGQHHIARVVDNENVLELLEKLRNAGATDLMFMIPKIKEALPELAPALPAVKALLKAVEIQNQIINEMVKRIEKLEGGSSGS